MSETATKPVYFVDAYSEPVLVRIEGRASFQNCACLRDFIAEMSRRGKARFVLDFLHCTGVDSTFLGVLAGAAQALRPPGGNGGLILARVGPRNLELLRNLGLHRLLTVDAGDFAMDFDRRGAALDCRNAEELESARLVLEAHENLVAADPNNASKFQDVMAFLKGRVEQG